MKGGLAAILTTAKVLSQHDIALNGSLQLAIVSDEESGGSMGTGYLVENGYLDADMAVVAEPSEFKMSVAEGGLLWFELITRGDQVHSINARDATNAIHLMARAINSLENVARQLAEIHHEEHGAPILSVNTVRGGVKTNLLPAECRASVDFRFPPEIGMTIESAKELIASTLGELEHADPRCSVEVEYQNIAHPFAQSKEIEIAKELRRAAEEVLGETIEWWHESKKAVIPTDDSDVYHLYVKGGVPSVYFGPGMLKDCHVVDESIDVEDIVQAARIFTMLALNVLTDLD